MHSSSGSSQPRDQTEASHITGEFFTNWSTREAQEYWSGEPIPFPVDLPNPGIVSGSQADSVLAELQGKFHINMHIISICIPYIYIHIISICMKIWLIKNKQINFCKVEQNCRNSWLLFKVKFSCYDSIYIQIFFQNYSIQLYSGFHRIPIIRKLKWSIKGCGCRGKCKCVVKICVIPFENPKA